MESTVSEVASVQSFSFEFSETSKEKLLVVSANLLLIDLILLYVRSCSFLYCYVISIKYQKTGTDFLNSRKAIVESYSSDRLELF